MKPQPAREKTPAATPAHAPAKRPAAVARRRDHLFYTGMAVAVTVTVVVGFGPTYFFKPIVGGPPLSPLLRVHGAVFSAWVALYLVQSGLVAASRTRVHRRLGMLGAALAALMVVVGAVTAVVRASQGATPVPDVSPLAFLVIPLGDVTVFSILVGTGISFRRRPDVHKRLMALAMISLLAAAVARLPLVGPGGPLAFFGLTDLFAVACVLYDLYALKRVHRATALGALLLVASQPLRLLIATTPAWLAFAGWLTGLAR